MLKKSLLHHTLPLSKQKRTQINFSHFLGSFGRWVQRYFTTFKVHEWGFSTHANLEEKFQLQQFTEQMAWQQTSFRSFLRMRIHLIIVVNYCIIWTFEREKNQQIVCLPVQSFVRVNEFWADNKLVCQEKNIISVLFAWLFLPSAWCHYYLLAWTNNDLSGLFRSGVESNMMPRIGEIKSHLFLCFQGQECGNHMNTDCRKIIKSP